MLQVASEYHVNPHRATGDDVYMGLVPSLVLALARATGVSPDVIKVAFDIPPEALGCIRRDGCDSCSYCPRRETDG